MDLNPDDSYLPGIEESVVHENRADLDDVFKEGDRWNIRAPCGNSRHSLRKI